MRYCIHCGNVIDEYNEDRNSFNCGVCGAIFLEDDMTALKYAKLSEKEKDEYDLDLLSIIKNSVCFDEIMYNSYQSMESGEFWRGFRPDKFLKLHTFAKEEYKENYINWRKENEPFKPFPPIDKEKAREYARSTVEDHKGLKQMSVHQSANIPKCPTCQSTNIEKISLTSKVVGGALFGLFSSNVRKTMHCKNCGYKW